MEDLAGFERELEAAIDRKKEYAANSIVPALPQHVRTLRGGMETIYQVLLKKGLIREDPYKYEEQISDLDVPADLPFSEQERDRELSIRLSAYLARLEYLAQYYDLTLESLDLKRLKELTRFIRFINWRNLTENSTAATTRGLAEQIAKVSGSGDQLSANLLTDAKEQMAKALASLNDLLRDLLSLRREEYKFEIRSRVLATRDIQPGPDESALNEAARAVRSILPRAAPGRPFVRELVLEVFAENRQPAGVALRRDVLERLRVPETQQASRRPAVDLKGILLDGARALSMAGRPLAEIARILSDNVVILEARKVTFGEFLKRVWARMRGREPDPRIFAVELVDDETGTSRSVNVDLNEMIAALSRRGRLYSGILGRGSAWQRLTEATPDAILGFLTRDTAENLQAMRRAEAIETYIKSEVAREQRSQLRPIAEQISAVREAVQRARRKAHEYVSKSEELDQLRRLGIDS